MTEQEVTDKRLSADGKFVGQAEPRANAYSALGNIFFKKLSLFGICFKIVLNGHSLRVKVEMSVFGIFFKNVHQHIEHIAEHILSSSCRKTPFSVPMGVGDEMAVNFLRFVVHLSVLLFCFQ